MILNADLCKCHRIVCLSYLEQLVILLEFLFFIQHKKVSAGISIYNKKFISVFCEDFLDSLFKMEKKENKSCNASIRKKLFKKKNEHFENILLLNVLPMHHQSASEHAFPLV